MDEADRLLEETFMPDLKVILEYLPKERQTLLFTATMTPEIEALEFSESKAPFIFRGNEKYDTVEKLDQRYMFIPSSVKDGYLVQLLRSKYDLYTHTEKKTSDKYVPNVKESKQLTKPSNSDFIIIFTGKWKTCERLYLTLRELGIRCTALHSHLSQSERLSTLAKFKSGIVTVLIATDVGSR